MSSILGSKKCDVGDLAIFGGKPVFSSPVSTSNLLRPDVEKFLEYSKIFYRQQQYTNNGPLVRVLEHRLAEFHEVECCVAFCSGFWALALAIKELAIPGRTEIIMPSLTYRRMNDIAVWVGLKPHFCEVDPVTLAMTPDTVSACINKNTAIILGVHPIINCCEADDISKLADAVDVPILFDSVESVYETFSGGRVGGFGAAEAFSLHACKLLNGFGGGYLTTNDARLARKLGLMRGFGFEVSDHVAVPGGTNAKLNEMHAAAALASLDDVDAQVVLNRERYQAYKALLKDVPGIRLVEFDPRYRSGFKNIVVELTTSWPLSREETVKILNREGILARSYYAPALHRKSNAASHVSAELPITEGLAECFLNLPCGQRVTIEAIGQISEFLLFLYTNAQLIADHRSTNWAA